MACLLCSGFDFDAGGEGLGRSSDPAVEAGREEIEEWGRGGIEGPGVARLLGRKNGDAIKFVGGSREGQSK